MRILKHDSEVVQLQCFIYKILIFSPGVELENLSVCVEGLAFQLLSDRKFEFHPTKYDQKQWRISFVNRSRKPSSEEWVLMPLEPPPYSRSATVQKVLFSRFLGLPDIEISPIKKKLFFFYEGVFILQLRTNENIPTQTLDEQSGRNLERSKSQNLARSPSTRIMVFGVLWNIIESQSRA